MKIFKPVYERMIRLTIAICHQIPWLFVGIAFYFYAHHSFPQKIQSAFGISEAQERLVQATQSTTFMKNMISLSNPMASFNYLTSLMEQTIAWSRLNSSQMFANVCTIFSLWIIDAFLFLGGLYLIWRVIKIYRQKGKQTENVRLISKELAPSFNILQKEIHSLRTELERLKNAKSNLTNSPEPRG